MPDEYKELVVHQMMAHTEGELSGADDYLELFYPMTDDPYEKKVCCERGGEEVDHYRKGAKVLADIGQGAAFMLDIPLQERSLYATEAVKRINDWPERGFFSMLGEAAVFDILKEMAESSYKPIADMCPGVITEERVHVAHGLRIIRSLCQTSSGREQAQPGAPALVARGARRLRPQRLEAVAALRQVTAPQVHERRGARPVHRGDRPQAGAAGAHGTGLER
jgi:ring-1,2-phenylacetyl-CoA epoxidase subunit PaaA